MRHKEIHNEEYVAITRKAQSLFERYQTSLLHRQVPDELSLNQLYKWTQNFNARIFSLRDRIQLFKKSAIENAENYNNWINDFQRIINLYDSEIIQEKIYSLERNIPFQKILYPFVYFTIAPIYEEILKKRNLLTSEVLMSLETYLLKYFSDISALCFYEDLVQKNQECAFGSKILDYNTYCESFYSDFSHNFFQEYSSLAKLLVVQSSHLRKAFYSFILRLNQDLLQLSKHFFNITELDRIKRITPEKGFMTSTFGPNCTIEFENGNKLIYKTKSAIGDHFYNDLMKEINHYSSKIALKGYKVIDRGDYSWHEYIPYSSIKNKVSLKKFYKRLGILTAISQILGSNDYHFGNIIAKAAHPILVDHETIFPNPLRIVQDPDLALSNLLVNNITDGSDLTNQMLGGIHREISMKVIGCEIDSKNNVILTKKKIVWKGKNIPKYKGKKAKVMDFEQSLLSGYIYGLKLLKENQNTFISFISNWLNNNEVKIRFLFRPTLKYINIFVKSLKPEHMKSGVDRSIFFECVFKSVSQKKMSKKDAAFMISELDDFEQGIIPKFIIDIKTKAVVGKNISITKQLKDPMDQIIHNFDMLKQSQFIKSQTKLLQSHLKSNK